MNVKEFKDFLKEAQERQREPTPEFFKKWSRWMWLLAAAAGLVSPVFLAVGMPVASAIAGSVVIGATASAKTAKQASTTRGNN